MPTFIAEHPVSFTFAVLGLVLLLGGMRNRIVEAIASIFNFTAAPFLICCLQMRRLLPQVSDWIDRGLSTLKASSTRDQQKPWISLHDEDRARLVRLCLVGLGLTFAAVAVLFLWGAAVQTGDGSPGEFENGLTWLFWILIATPLLGATALALWAALNSPKALIVLMLMLARAFLYAVDAAFRAFVWVLDALAHLLTSMLDVPASLGAAILNVVGRRLPADWRFEITFIERPRIGAELQRPATEAQTTPNPSGGDAASGWDVLIYPVLWLLLGLTLLASDIYAADLRLAALLGVRPHLAFTDLPLDLFVAVALVCTAAAFAFALAELRRSAPPQANEQPPITSGVIRVPPEPVPFRVAANPGEDDAVAAREPAPDETRTVAVPASNVRARRYRKVV